MVDKSKIWVQDAIEEAFDYFDTDKTGFIEPNEFSQILSGSNND